MIDQTTENTNEDMNSKEEQSYKISLTHEELMFLDNNMLVAYNLVAGSEAETHDGPVLIPIATTLPLAAIQGVPVSYTVINKIAFALFLITEQDYIDKEIDIHISLIDLMQLRETTRSRFGSERSPLQKNLSKKIYNAILSDKIEAHKHNKTSEKLLSQVDSPVHEVDENEVTEGIKKRVPKGGQSK